GAVALGGEPRLARVQLRQTLGHDGKVGARYRFVEPHHNVACFDMIAVTHPHFAHDAAGRMLHLLDVRIDDERTLRDECAGNLSRGRPAADPAAEQDDDGDAEKDVPPDRNARWGRRFFFHPAPPASGTTFNARGAGAGHCNTLLRISSFGPNCCWRPLAMTRIKSTAAIALGRCATTTTIPPRARTPMIAFVSASSPSESRLELGSSSTTRNGSR